MPQNSQILNEIVSWYLYGQDTPPDDFSQTSFIRPLGVTATYAMLAANYMAGIFARGSMSL